MGMGLNPLDYYASQSTPCHYDPFKLNVEAKNNREKTRRHRADPSTSTEVVIIQVQRLVV